MGRTKEVGRCMITGGMAPRKDLGSLAAPPITGGVKKPNYYKIKVTTKPKSQVEVSATSSESDSDTSESQDEDKTSKSGSETSESQDEDETSKSESETSESQDEDETGKSQVRISATSPNPKVETSKSESETRKSQDKTGKSQVRISATPCKPEVETSESESKKRKSQDEPGKSQIHRLGSQQHHLNQKAEVETSKSEVINISSRDYDKNKLIARADKFISEADILTKHNNKWNIATPKYEKAANLYRNARNYENAKEAFKKASKGEEISSWLNPAGRHLESAAELAFKLGNWTEVYDLYCSASKLYFEDGALLSKFVDPLRKGAQALKDVAPAIAIQLYIQVIDIHEEYDDHKISSLIYTDAIEIYIKLEKYTDAAALSFRLGLDGVKNKFVWTDHCKAYLSAIILYLYANDFNQAEKHYLHAQDFLKSEHKCWAVKLLSAYREADADEIKRVVRDSPCTKYLNRTIVSLVNKLPTG